MYLSRKIDASLLSWATLAKRKPLIIRGARQVGKTAAVKQLGATHFRSFLLINFERQPRLRAAFEQDLNPKRILAELEALTDSKITPGETLLFFDEIQDCPRAVTALRYFYEEMPELHVLAAGSLLEFVWENLSVPVGRVAYLQMFPLTFVEFLNATQRSQLVQHIPTVASKPGLPASVAAALWAALKEYFLVGGMPEAVVTYVQSQSFTQVAALQDDLLQTYRDDFHKYAKGSKQLENLSQIFTRLFGFVGKQLKYTAISEGDDINRTRASLELLEKARIIHRVKATAAGGLPLSTQVNEKKFKFIFIDIGLGQRAAGIKAGEFLHADNIIGFHNGTLAEQFVGQELVAQNDKPYASDLYYWSRDAKGSSAEVDFLIVRNGKITPIEVKSGSAGRLRSLHLFLDQYGGRGICLQQRDRIESLERIDFLPLFASLLETEIV